MGRAIVNKLLHAPTAKLRAVGPAEAGERLVDAATELFSLEEPDAAPLQASGEPRP
jgi:glutamyl-tRNA reductase